MDEKLAAICAQLHPQGKTEAPSVQQQRRLAAESEKLVLHRNLGHQCSGLAMLSKAFEDLCSQAIAAPL